MAKSIDIVLLLRMLIKKWYLFFLTGAVSLTLGLMLTTEVKPNVYESYASISSLAAGSYKDSAEGVQILKNYSELVYSNKIASAAKASLPGSISTEQIQGMVSASFDVDSSIFYISSKSSDSQTAVNVANAVADAFVAELGNITGSDTIKIYDRAMTAVKTFDGKSDQRKMRLAIPSVSLFLLFVSLCLWTLFSGKIRSVGEAELGGEVAVIGVIPRT